MVVTDRDRQILSMLAEYRFVTLDHLVRAGIFSGAGTPARRRIKALTQGRYIRRGQIGGTLYYYLSPRGGLEVGLPDSPNARRYRDAKPMTVVEHLIWCDFALARKVRYLSEAEARKELSGQNLTTVKALTHRRLKLYRSSGILHALVVDLGFDVFPRHLRVLAQLPPVCHIDALVFSPARERQAQQILALATPRATVIRTDWKYFLGRKAS